MAGSGAETHESIQIHGRAEGTTVAEICRKAGISQATYFNWKKKYAGMLPTDIKKLRELEDEYRRLKKIDADRALDKEMLRDVIKRKL